MQKQEIMDVLEGKLRDFIDKNNKIIDSYGELRSELMYLKDKISGLEEEKIQLRQRVDTIIEKIEIHLRNSG